MKNQKVITFNNMEWNLIKENDIGSYYLLNGFFKRSKFGKDVNYANSLVRSELNNGNLAEKLRIEFNEKLVLINTDLIALNGENDFGVVKGDVLSIPTLDLYRECRKNIVTIDEMWWLATPEGTQLNGKERLCLLCVDKKGFIDQTLILGSNAIRPYFILRN